MELTHASWRKSSRSGLNANACVEVASNLPLVVGLRDSKDCAGPVLAVPHQGWTSFITATKAGTFDL